MAINYTNALKRIVSLSSSDAGFLLLALHSFLEGLANALNPGFSYYAKFPEVIDLLMEEAQGRRGLSPEVRKSFIRFAKQHDLANRVRHQFSAVTRDEAEASVYNFLAVCEGLGIQDAALGELADSIKRFGAGGSSGYELAKELESAKRRLQDLEAAGESLLRQSERYDELKQELEAIKAREEGQRRELDQLRDAVDRKDGKVDELRSRLRRTEEEKAQVAAALSRYDGVGDYLSYLERFSLFTRTRVDFERSVMKLTPEQEAAVESVKERGDYLVKGGAGTGKTLVLLHALERYLASARQSLGFEGRADILLLTYTNTLVKYSRYLAAVVGKDEGAIRVFTADAFLVSAFGRRFPGAHIDFKLPGAAIKPYNATSFLSDEELATEIEDVIWANMISEEDYLEKHILRRGMKQPLNQAQRKLVWEIQRRLSERAAETGAYSRNLACLRLLERLGGEAEAGAAPEDGAARIFVDEAQDLPAVMLRVFKELSSSGLVLAADDGQSIYKIGSPYLRSGVSVSGRTKVLKTNFRNTRQIHDAAERYLGAAARDERANSILREGPEPELVRAESAAELRKELVKYVRLAVDKLGYDPENVGVLAPSNREAGLVEDLLKKEGLAAASVKAEDFSFAAPGIVRVSTLHSSKGLEFPLTLLWLPFLPAYDDLDEKASQAMLRNLVYVSLTRAMDHAVVFMKLEPNEVCLSELAASLSIIKEQ